MAMQHILAIAGSLRSDSYNRRLLDAARLAAADRFVVTVYDALASIPMFSEDLEATTDANPGPVRELRDLVAAADGLLVATPEYNQSLPGVMKNVVDWLSRPGPDEVLDRKPIAIVGATTGPWGTRYAQKELRHVLAATGAYVMPQPMLFLPHAVAAFAPDGRLREPRMQRQLENVLRSFEEWIELVGAPALARVSRGAA